MPDFLRLPAPQFRAARIFLTLPAWVAFIFATHAARAQTPLDVLPPLSRQPAIMDLLLPAGATATVDGREVGAVRTFTFDQFKSNETQRANITVRFADGTEAKRLVDLEAGRHVRVPVLLTPVDKPVAVVTESPVAVLWAAFSPDGRLCATASENGAVVVWDLKAGRPVLNISGHIDAVQAVAFSPDGEQLLTASTDLTAVLWNLRTGKAVRKLKGHSAGVTSAVFSRDGKQIATGSSDSTAILWNAQTGAQIRKFEGHTNEVVGVALSPDGKKLATASTDRLAILWNAETGARQFTLRHNDTVSGVVFSSDGVYLAAASFNNTATFWTTADGRSAGATRRVNLDVNGVAFSPDDRWTFTAGKDATVKMWQSDTSALIREFAGHSTDISSVTTSPDGRLLLTASRDGTARLWDIATGSELASFASREEGRSWAVVAPDGLFDGSDAGRRMMGLRFGGKLPGAVMDQFFHAYYRPGLLAELWRGDRPMVRTQLGLSLPPLVKITAPKARSTTNDQVTVQVDAMDQGGGVSDLRVFNNGARIRVAPEITRDGSTTRHTFPMTLVRGANQIRLHTASGDGAWESMTAELELNSSHRAVRRSRLFIVAVGSEPVARRETKLARKDALALAEALKQRSAQLYERVDIVPLFGEGTTRTKITETLKDVAALAEPQDTLALLMSGRGALRDDEVYYFTSQVKTPGLPGGELAALLGSSPALQRVMILDIMLSELTESAANVDVALRGAVEQWSRAQGVFVAASVSPASSPKDFLTGALLASLGHGESTVWAEDLNERAAPNGTLDVMQWFQFTLERAFPALASPARTLGVAHASTQMRGFPLLFVAK